MHRNFPSVLYCQTAHVEKKNNVTRLVGRILQVSCPFFEAIGLHVLWAGNPKVCPSKLSVLY